MELSDYLKILSDENKFRIVKHLMRGEECVCTIAQSLGLEQSLVSHHLNKLREAGLITDRKVGSWVHCSLNKEVFEKLEKSFLKELSASNISEKPCCVHQICCQLQEEKNEK
jgi:ArsR family transcriptional regulator, arsenate/arsenite/antimonite-responsive transcriptional repressor